MSEVTSSEPAAAADGVEVVPVEQLISRHLQIGWWSLLVFLTLGIGLEALHGFKIPWYLNVDDTLTRRLMWRLAHVHGGMIALVHIAFAATLYVVELPPSNWQSWASGCLTAAGIMMPVGFFLGGVWFYGGDPGEGIFLVPPGALLLFAAVVLTARAIAGVSPRTLDR